MLIARRLFVFLVVSVLLGGWSAPSVHGQATKMVATGTAVAKFASLESAVHEHMKLVDASTATLAVAFEGKVMLSRGFGHRDAARKTPAAPDTMMRIASVTKPVTAAIVHQLIAAKKITRDTAVFDYLKIVVPSGNKVDPRWQKVTVGHLLDHKGGWDREATFDPLFETQRIEDALRLKKPVQPGDVVRFMAGRPLDFEPGERVSYSNFGYCLLGRVIEKATGKTFMNYVQQDFCKELGVKDLRPARYAVKDRDVREVWYPANVNVELMDSNGGLIASAPALLTFMDKYWLDGRPRNHDNTFYFQYGSLPGTTALAIQRQDRWDIAVLMNNRRNQSYAKDNEQLKKALNDALDGAMKK